MNLSNLEPFAELAIKLATEHAFKIKVCSKWTISPSERIFVERITKVLKDRGISFEKVLTDIAVARIASNKNGGRLWIFDNPNGDTASDVADLVDGSRSMGSRLFCKDGFCYEELPGGTAPSFIGSCFDESVEDNFFNPLGIILAIASATEQANPHLSRWIKQVRACAVKNVTEATKGSRHTLKIIENIAEETQ